MNGRRAKRLRRDRAGQPRRASATPSVGAPAPAPTDPRIVTGARCTWWDSIDKTSSTRVGGLPCCPFCGGVLFEVANEAEWWGQVDVYALANPGYRELIEFLRGRCFPDMDIARAAYGEATA